MPLQERCCKNHFEYADDYCNRCGLPFSNEFLVYAFGQAKPPLCVSCALAQSGVRSNAGNRPTVSRRELRKREKARKQELKAKKSKAPKVSTEPISIDWSLPEDDGENDTDLSDRRAVPAAPAPSGSPDLSKAPPPPAAAPPPPKAPIGDAEVSESLDWIERYAASEPTPEETPAEPTTPKTSKRITF